MLVCSGQNDAMGLYMLHGHLLLWVKREGGNACIMTWAFWGQVALYLYWYAEVAIPSGQDMSERAEYIHVKSNVRAPKPR